MRTTNSLKFEQRDEIELWKMNQKMGKRNDETFFQMTNRHKDEIDLFKLKRKIEENKLSSNDRGGRLVFSYR